MSVNRNVTVPVGSSLTLIPAPRSAVGTWVKSRVREARGTASTRVRSIKTRRSVVPRCAGVDRDELVDEERGPDLEEQQREDDRDGEGDDQLHPRQLGLHLFALFLRRVVRGDGERAKSDREYLPTLNAAVQLHNEMLSVPVSVGGAYYLAPYNQGDFQARAYLGVGVVSMVYNRVVFQQEVQGIPDVPTVYSVGTADSPGYYAETGAHMFFASRFSVLLGVQYRSAKIRHIADATTGIPFRAPNGDPYTLDLSGLGAKFAVGIGL